MREREKSSVVWKIGDVLQGVSEGEGKNESVRDCDVRQEIETWPGEGEVKDLLV